MDPDHERMEDIDAGRKRKRILTSSGECSPASERDIPDDVYQDRSEDDPDDVDSQDEGFIDDTEQGVAHRPSFDPSVSPAPEPSQGQSESSDDDGDTPTGSPEPDSLYAKSNNNLSRSLRMVHALEYCELTETEGTPLFWLSESVGPSIPAMAMQQILCLQHLLNFPLNGDHIMSNQFLEVLWMAGKGRGKKARALEKLVYHMDLKDSEIQRRQRNRARYQDATIDDYPENFYCNFSAAPGASKVASVMSFADILLAPCVASYKSRSTGAGMRKVFWLVILKTRIVYNVCAHLCDFLKQKDSAGLDFASQRRAEDVYLLWKEIILHQHSMSPSVIAMCKKQHIVPANPMLNLDQAGEPDSLMACCNVFEVYRAMKQRCMAQGARLPSPDHQRGSRCLLRLCVPSWLHPPSLGACCTPTAMAIMRARS